MYFVRDGNVKGLSRYLRETRICQGIFKRRGEQEDKQKLSVQEVNSSTF